ncbi:hypothetical protein ACWD1Y_05080 [Streptomyces sp. NPDC002814]|jgi:hypothetical protein
MRTLAAWGCVITTVIGLSVGITSTAQATATQCRQYLRDVGYIVGPQAQRACDDGQAGRQLDCVVRLNNIGVEARHAGTACQLADA